MKKILLSMMLGVFSITGSAQGNLQFTINRSAQKDISETVVNALDLKLKQVMNRNSAAAADAYNVFAIGPSIELTDIVSTEGMVQNVSVAKGNLTLIAKNKIDGAMYYQMTIPVKGDAFGNNEKALLKMISNIKVTDPAFTRFIRISRQKIEEYYDANCSIILQKAKSLSDQGKYKEAMSYLSAISPSLPCYQQSYELEKEISANIPPEVQHDTVVVEKEVEKIVEKEVEKPVNTPAPDNVECQISISTQDFTFKVLECFGDMTQRRITIKAAITNVTNRNFKGLWVKMLSAYSDEGVQLHSLSVEKDWQDFPSNITVPRNFYITNIDSKIDKLSFVDLKIDDTVVEIRNLPVRWK